MIDYGLAGKIAIVTGGAGVIGQATVAKLVAQGVKVVVPDIEASALEQLGNKYPQDKVLPVHADVSTESGTQEYVHAAVSRFGKIDLLVNNAVTLGPRQSFLELGIDDFDKVMAVNVRGTFLGLKFVMKQMIAQGHGGSIVNMGSIGAMRPSRSKTPAYAASKAAIICLSSAASVFGGSHKIRVNAVCPGGTDTPLVSPENRLPTSTFYAHLPIPRLGRPEEIANFIVYILGNEATFQTGGIYTIDGGATQV